MKRIDSVAVVGLGYVGLPLAMLAEQKGFRVVGIEKSPNKLAALKARKPVIDDVTANRLLKKSKIEFTDDFASVSDCDAVIICVPTPVDNQKTPDLSLVEKAVTAAVKNMKAGSLLVIESTINPGVCDEVVTPLIQSNKQHRLGKTIFLAHCPERINPGDPKWHVGNINRVLGADSPEGLELAYGLYTRLIDADIMKMGSLKEAEAVKVVENSFRDINIAFVNELAMSFALLGIDTVNVINGAATKPFSFMPHYPGIGVGGHCIPVDPYYLIEYARKNGFEHKFLTLARGINETMPAYTIERLADELKNKGVKSLKGVAVAVLGLSYKSNVADDRESPSYKVIAELEARGAKVDTYDPYMLEKSTAKTLAQVLTNKQAVVLVTSHEEFLALDKANLGGVKVVVDGRNALKADKITAKGIGYIGIGSNS